MLKQNRKIILASGSPRRKGYLERYGLQFTVQSADVDESVRSGEKPIDYAKRMAKVKGKTVAGKNRDDAIVISADTIVVLGNQILGKPGSRDDVLPMLKRLNGKEHEVITSFYVCDCLTKDEIQRETTTKVMFIDASLEQLTAYAALDEPMDKAGAYSIQGLGTFLVCSIKGSYNNVVGLPIESLLQILLENNWLSVHS